MNDNFNIIAFAGRKESGKTELARICIENGYEVRSFATELKKLVCRLTGIDGIDTLNTNKTRRIGISGSDEISAKLSKETGISPEGCIEGCSKLTEDSTARDWLQVVGTDIIRKYDADWHVRKTLETMEEGKKYVFDDLRFPNELKALNGLGAECWFIIRNRTDNISNHLSETSLDYRDFSYHVIVNNTSLEEFRRRWTMYLMCHDVTCPMREWAVSHIFMNATLPISEDVLEKYYVYEDFKHFWKRVPAPSVLIENDTRTGFVGDGSNPFITEDWKRKYVN